jgi:hypothetical protein
MPANIRTTRSAWLFLLAAGTASCGSTEAAGVKRFRYQEVSSGGSGLQDHP